MKYILIHTRARFLKNKPLQIPPGSKLKPLSAFHFPGAFTKLKGIYAPIVTPFHADESINYLSLEQLIKYHIANKIAGLVPGGATGEVYAFNCYVEKPS